MKEAVMEWLSYERAVAQRFQVTGSPPQYLELAADLATLGDQIPIPSRFEEMGLIPGPSFQWYARVGERSLIIEREKETDAPYQRVFIHTSYLPTQDKFGDWTVLKELFELPPAIDLVRPVFILSRTLNPKYVVFRPHPSGWNTTVYNASSSSEAGELLGFLKKDGLNQECFAGPPEPEGVWSAIRIENGREEVLCTYPNRSGAVSVACNLSLRYPLRQLVVKDRSQVNPQQYTISKGRIVSQRD